CTYRSTPPFKNKVWPMIKFKQPSSALGAYEALDDRSWVLATSPLMCHSLIYSVLCSRVMSRLCVP
ncbi:hypothetical protein M404DRAFT_998492, partial [Pisolithus tinctorius Marx 270]